MYTAAGVPIKKNLPISDIICVYSSIPPTSVSTLQPHSFSGEIGHTARWRSLVQLTSIYPKIPAPEFGSLRRWREKTAAILRFYVLYLLNTSRCDQYHRQSPELFPLSPISKTNQHVPDATCSVLRRAICTVLRSVLEPTVKPSHTEKRVLRKVLRT